MLVKTNSKLLQAVQMDFIHDNTADSKSVVLNVGGVYTFYYADGPYRDPEVPVVETITGKLSRIEYKSERSLIPSDKTVATLFIDASTEFNSKMIELNTSTIRDVVSVDNTIFDNMINEIEQHISDVSVSRVDPIDPTSDYKISISFDNTSRELILTAIDPNSELTAIATSRSY